MDINFPLVLVCVVVCMAAILLVDKLILRQNRPEGAKEPWAVEFSRSLFGVFVLVLVIRSFVIEPFKIPSASMEPTLLVGDFILVNKFTYGLRLPVLGTKVLSINEPQRGDVMVFIPPHDPRYFIKRVIGLPGDEIRYINNVLYINGKQVEQVLVGEEPQNNFPVNYLFEEMLPEGKKFITRKRRHPELYSRNFGPVKVPEGHYFMMGDNRDRSADSRVWGYVPEKNIVGQAFFVWLHWPSLLSLPNFGTMRIIN